ncbi:M50 family metallopeptidase [Alteribacter keqinensis]|uniref:M50 family peptidase n=1 Tax=Alteribacter keqinensis TaxID=2483800 RepID=A0A3M7TUK3_9BACI|nr:M50 family metallopeptidase [Alteribacter keqinensis]RNA69328.1 M50 family peptidase [Alteribacter keqinensis]
MNDDLYFYILLFIIVLGITYLPVIGSYFRLFNTLIHESLGHALVARLTGGRVVSISLFQNTGGLAVFQHHWFGRVITVFCGYPVSSLMSVVVIYLITQGYFEEIALGLFILLIYVLIFWVRNLVGWLWVLSVIGGLTAVYIYAEQRYFELLITVIGITILTQAFASSWGIFMLSVFRNRQAGDAMLLAEATKVPAVIWGTVFMLQGTFFFIIGTMIFFGYDVINLI